MDLDSATIARISLLYPNFRVRLLRVYADMWEHERIQMRCTEALRTFAYQQTLYDQGRTTPGKIVTRSLPGYSFHHYGVAADSCRVGKNPYDVPWNRFGAFARGHGLTWGGDWNGNGIEEPQDFDRPHTQLAYGGLRVARLLELYQNKGLSSVWAEFDRIRGVPVESEWNAANLLTMGDL